MGLLQRVVQAFKHRVTESGYPPLGFIHECDELGCFECGGVVLDLGDGRNGSFCDQLQHEMLLLCELERHAGILMDRADTGREGRSWRRDAAQPSKDRALTYPLAGQAKEVVSALRNAPSATAARWRRLLAPRITALGET